MLHMEYSRTTFYYHYLMIDCFRSKSNTFPATSLFFGGVGEHSNSRFCDTSFCFQSMHFKLECFQPPLSKSKRISSEPLKQLLSLLDRYWTKVSPYLFSYPSWKQPELKMGPPTCMFRSRNVQILLSWPYQNPPQVVLSDTRKSTALYYFQRRAR